MLRVLPAIKRLVKHASHKTVFTRFLPPASSEDAGGQWKAFYRRWECVTRDRLDPQLLEITDELSIFATADRVVDRSTYSAFCASDLHALLQEKRCDTLIISGGETDVCVLVTTLAAVDIGYRVVLAEDALCSQSDQSHEALLSIFKSRFQMQVQVAATEDMLNAWPVSP